MLIKKCDYNKGTVTNFMKPLFQVSTRNPKEIVSVKKAMEELESTCKVKNGFDISEPMSKFGWTFFNIKLSSEIVPIIEKSGMMKGVYGHKIGEQLQNFLGHWFEKRGIQFEIKLINY